MATAEELIEEARERNAELTEAAIDAAEDVMTAASGRIFPPAGFVAVVPPLRSTPPPFSPNTDLGYDFTNAYQQAFADFNPIVLQAVLDFLARFFPGALAQVVDDWIQNAIVNGGTGIPAAIEQAIWERARAREVTEAGKLEQQAYDQFASRGFVMPPGALAARVLQVQQDASDKSVALSRDIAIRMHEVEVQQVRFAIENGLKVRLAVIGAISDYIKAWLAPAEEAVKYATGLVGAKERLWNEAANYYRAMIEEAGLKIRAQEITAGSRDRMVLADVDSFKSYVAGQIQAAMTVAETIGKAAAGSLNAQSASVSQSDQRVGPIV